MSRIACDVSSAANPPPPDLPSAALRHACSCSRWLWALPFLFLSLLLTVSFSPLFARTSGLDVSYQFCVGYAFLHHFRFGSEFVSSFGPWGFAYCNIYQPGLMRWMLTAQIIVGLGVFSGLWRIAHNLGIHPLFAGLWVVLISLWPVSAFDDARILAICLLPMLIRRTHPRQLDSPASFVLIFALALAALCKFTFFTTATGAIGLLSIEDLICKRPPKLALCFVASLLLLWRITGQAFADLPNYLLNSWSLSEGYSAAMGQIAPDFFMIPTFLALSTAILCLVFARFWKDSRLGAIVAFLTTAGTLFIIFKEGFVRWDAHERAATTALLIIASISLPILWVHWYHQPPRRSVILVRSLGLAILTASLWCAAQSYDRFLPGQHLSSSLKSKPAIIQDCLQRGWSWFWHPNEEANDAIYRDGLAAVRADCPLPLLSGTTDMFGFNQLAIIAAGMDYRPRPVTPGYQAWTPRLIELNRLSLLGSRAPDNIFFSPESMDNRFPSIDDGTLWPILLSNYLPAEITPSGFLVLHRSPQPNPTSLTPLSSATYHLDQHIPVPPGSVWVQIELRQTLFGKLATFLLRGPEVDLDFKTTDGNTSRRRIIPAMGRAGFLLSPFVKDPIDFFSLLSRHPHPPNVTAIAIHVRSNWTIMNAFEPNFQVSFQQLNIPRIPPGTLPTLASPASFH